MYKFLIGRDTTTENYPGRVTSYDNLYGEARSKGVPFSGFTCMKA